MKEPKLNDAQKTTLMLDLLAADCVDRGNGAKEGTKMMAARKVFLTEVADGTGFSPGYADGFELALWGSDGFEADGYEVKASKSDLNRELSDLSKWQRVGCRCNRWWLVVWDAKWLDDPRIPAEWGLLAREHRDGEEHLKVVRRATPKAETPEWSRHFVCAVVRRAAEASPSAALLVAMMDRGISRGKSMGRDTERAIQRDALKPLLEHYRQSGTDYHTKWATDVPLDWVVQQALAYFDKPTLSLTGDAS